DGPGVVGQVADLDRSAADHLPRRERGDQRVDLHRGPSLAMAPAEAVAHGWARSRPLQHFYDTSVTDTCARPGYARLGEEAGRTVLRPPGRDWRNSARRRGAMVVPRQGRRECS